MRIVFLLLCFFIFLPTAMASQTYLCPMHPHIQGTQGEHCPICGMALTPRKNSTPHESKKSMPAQTAPDDLVAPETINLAPFLQQALGVTTTTVAWHKFGQNIRAFATIVPSTRHEWVIAMRTEGWIVDLATAAVGDNVHKGDLLFTYYSPKLMTEQSDYLIRGHRASRDKQGNSLKLYGMDEQSIAELKAKGQMMEATPFYAPQDGTVVKLHVRKGSFVKAGDIALSIQDFSQVWVHAQVLLQDLPFLRIGQPAKIMVPLTNQSYSSQIDFIHPVANATTHTVQVRLVVKNHSLATMPGTYVDVIFEGNSQQRLALPAKAVLYSGQGATVIESLGQGNFRPIKIQPGITANGLTEIISGLEAGQHIVTSGQFMLDADSNLNHGLAPVNDNIPDHEPVHEAT
jgi:Cu(I)/Ag(I) efflux system membrane fusion protein